MKQIHEIHDILSGFSNLKEYTEFMNQLAEKKASGDEISRGMNKHDKSKAEKSKTFVSKEVKKNANGSASEKHYSQVDPTIENPPEEPEAPPVPLQPGQQTNIGNKTVDPQAFQPRTIEVSVGKEKDKINLKPTVNKNPSSAI